MTTGPASVVRDNDRGESCDESDTGQPGHGAEFGPDERLYLSSGVGPSGEGDNTIAVFDRSGALPTPRLVTDPKLSPLDLKLAPNGNIVVASEWPFGAADAVPSVREYDPITGQLVRVFAPEPSVGFRRPRGIAVLARWPPVLRRGGPRRGLRTGAGPLARVNFPPGRAPR